MTIIQALGDYQGNNLWIKREDLIPFSFGGNKARKAELFFKEISNGNYDYVVTYGSSSSNHCRVIANECCRRGLKCFIISPEEACDPTYNSQMMDLFGADITIVPVSSVHSSIESKMSELNDLGYHPYFIEGGGHGNLGTEAYVQCYQEIKEQEADLGVFFDYIFFASGTGTTQAGLVCGQFLAGDNRKIVGISIARKNPRGRDIVLDSINSYLGEKSDDDKIRELTCFIDDYTSGYGQSDLNVQQTIDFVLKNYGIPLDSTYTGKAFWGMSQVMNSIHDKNILFIHTGGTPLFFDELRKRL